MEANKPHIPRLAISQIARWNDLVIPFLSQHIKIESWFRKMWQQHPPILTSSVDIRNAGFKIGAIDTNLFPAGFNNLNSDFFPLCIQALQSTLFEFYPKCQKILLLAENHTRNINYYQSLATLSHLLQLAGFEINIGSLLLSQTSTVTLPHGNNLTIYPLTKKTGRIMTTSGYMPCVVLLNNDLTEGIPELLQNIQQPIAPSPWLGWAYRSKSQHFSFYQDLCHQFASFLEIDPWLICPLFSTCENINFIERSGMEALKIQTENILSAISQKYQQYNIDYPPYVVIKADAGTYGMAVMTIRNAEELLQLNRKQRTNMAVSKGGTTVHKVIIQEGIPTFEKVEINACVAEPVVYMIGHHVVGGFYRLHAERGLDQNLNSPGMQFTKLSFATCCNIPSEQLPATDPQNQFYIYSVLARLALLAASHENAMLATQKDKNT